MNIVAVNIKQGGGLTILQQILYELNETDQEKLLDGFTSAVNKLINTIYETESDEELFMVKLRL